MKLLEKGRGESNFSSNQKYKLLPIILGAELVLEFSGVYIPND
jgi:hypothetical protein